MDFATKDFAVMGLIIALILFPLYFAFKIICESINYQITGLKKAFYIGLIIINLGVLIVVIYSIIELTF